jgi:hypothetical protein
LSTVLFCHTYSLNFKTECQVLYVLWTVRKKFLKHCLNHIFIVPLGTAMNSDHQIPSNFSYLTQAQIIFLQVYLQKIKYSMAFCVCVCAWFIAMSST